MSTVNNSPATVAYVWGNNYPTFDDGGPSQTILEFSIVSPKTASPIGTLTLPFSCDGGPLAADSYGNLYVACFSTSSAPSILVYPPNPSGTVAPLRTIVLDSSKYYEITTLTVGPANQLYVGALQNTNDVSFAVLVYADGSSGSVQPLRTLQLPGNNGLIDVAVDGVGNIYVAGYPENAGNGASSYVNVYSSFLGDSAILVRTIDFSYYVYGVAINQSGTLLVTAGNGPNASVSAIEEFAANATGYATAINTKSLASLPDSPGVLIGGGPVRVDGAGNVFAPLDAGSYPYFSYVLYGFGSTIPENALPIAQSAHNSYNTSFALR